MDFATFFYVFVTLGEGVVFGEISILNIPGRFKTLFIIYTIFLLQQNRESEKRSVGYSHLFSLSKVNF